MQLKCVQKIDCPASDLLSQIIVRSHGIFKREDLAASAWFMMTESASERWLDEGPGIFRDAVLQECIAAAKKDGAASIVLTAFSGRDVCKFRSYTACDHFFEV